MSKLTKEEVISTLESALSKAKGQTVSIEQKGSWYKIDGGKSLRFSELEAMLAEQGNSVEAPKPADKAKKAPATTKKSAPTKAAKEVQANKTSGAGMTPKELWRAKLAGKGQLPRGF
ncbi:hypothetical protein [Shewanella psychrotolerans]|uniref:hypothetical protein n=1 Tax=Shewanella psychrotolerans TaxID=2864206 RepID=UPI001C65C22E|nr:hypothetical protein [Shewanella psychrotolerans]QYK02753.1 hypothetical protein K0I62_07380 [Shewanella psychrotolerans]